MILVTSAALTASVTASYDGDCACPSENPITFTCNVTGAASVTWEHPSFGDISFSSGSSLNQPLVRGIFTVTLVSREVVGGALDYVTTLTADSIDSVNDTELVCRGYNLIGTVNMTDSVTVCVKGTSYVYMHACITDHLLNHNIHMYSKSAQV